MQKSSKYVVAGPSLLICGPFDTWIEAVNWVQSLDPILKDFEVLPVYTPKEYQDHQENLKKLRGIINGNLP